MKKKNVLNFAIVITLTGSFSLSCSKSDTHMVKVQYTNKTGFDLKGIKVGEALNMVNGKSKAEQTLKSAIRKNYGEEAIKVLFSIL